MADPHPPAASEAGAAPTAPAAAEARSVDAGAAWRGAGAGGAIGLVLASPRATEALGAALAGVLGPGDTVLLRGPLGAGKSALARAVIAARIGAGGEGAHIPSPSYTLVNVYDAPGGAVWHADLYRLGVGEVDELGLDDAYGTALVLVEWPERLGAARPARALELALAPLPDPDARAFSATAHGPGWAAVGRLLASWV